MNKDTLTTILGVAGGVITAAQPVLTAVQPGAPMTAQSWTQLALAVIFTVFGFFTNKPTT